MSLVFRARRVAALVPLLLSFPLLADGVAKDASSPIEFDNTISQCENRWFVAATEGGKDLLGYVYIDPAAGFTFEHYGHLDQSGGALRAVRAEFNDEARVIHRIDFDFQAACLSEAMVSALGLPTAPESMAFYKDQRPAGEHHASWAYHYNHIGANEAALEHISRAAELGYTSREMTFEHAFALNALGRFEETTALLSPIVEDAACPEDVIAELAYAYLLKGDLEEAIALYKRALGVAGEAPSQRRWEFARNIAAAYDRLGNASDRDIWLDASEKYKPGTE
jgi:tetratricopeptide (TPR) repeat protein